MASMETMHVPLSFGIMSEKTHEKKGCLSNSQTAIPCSMTSAQQCFSLSLSLSVRTKYSPPA